MPVSGILTPVLALVTWSCVMWFWMYATRIPAITKAKFDFDKPENRHPGALQALPFSVRRIADNYNHLMEQPTVFYAICFYAHLAGHGDGLNATLAWAYVGLRVVHSLFQSLVNIVPVRFVIFVLGSLCLFAIIAREVLARFA
jgi:hypothetical protein